ncbi:MAG: YceI family protein [Acidimicrobiales bacterium]|nr:MAG: YceI family protein [Acidimicrobiales bacterium]
MSNRRTVIITTCVLLVVVGAMGAYGAWRVLSAAPEEVSLDAAVAAVEEEQASNDGVEKVADTADALSTDGVWHVDTDSGSFSFEEASGSFVGFRVKEELVKIGDITAVGRTDQVEGELSIQNGQLVSVLITADLSAIVTNDSRRDNAARNAMNVRENPIASFVLDQPVDLPETDGSQISLQAEGQLTVNGITKAVIFELEAKAVARSIVVVGQTEVIFADYDIAVPSASIVVSAEDRGVVEFQLLFVRR